MARGMAILGVSVRDEYITPYLFETMEDANDWEAQADGCYREVHTGEVKIVNGRLQWMRGFDVPEE